MSYKSAFRADSHLPRLTDDDLLDAELERCARARMIKAAKRNGNHGPQRYCQCPELLLRKKRLPCPEGHNCSYVEQRSALVPEAERIANRGGNGFGWQLRFVNAMETLSKPLLKGSAARNRPQNGELSAGVSNGQNGHSDDSRAILVESEATSIVRPVQDATAAVAPMW